LHHRRSDPRGIEIVYEVEQDATHAEFDIIEDGEPPQSVYFPKSPGTDVRFIRGFRFKPTVEGTHMTMALRIYKDSTIGPDREIVGGTLIASASCPGVTVLP
jgi:hypothetical protein